MRYVILAIAMVLTGCECDSICKSQRQTQELLSNYNNDDDVVSFLELYNGEGPGSEKFSTFVKWGARHPDRYISIAQNGDVSEATHNRIFYAISDMGLSESYCLIYKSVPDSDHVLKMRKIIVGCK